ncbi:MAG: C10 family peptidase [Alloprevotella sp.]
MKKILFLIWLCMAWAVAAVAQPVSEAAASQTAAAFFGRYLPASGAARRADAVVKQAQTPRAYLFTQQRHFVLVAADEADPAILGYGIRAAQSELEAMPPALSALLSRPCRATAAAYPPPNASFTAVPPLLSTVRHQEAPYNNQCPYYRYADGTLSERPCVVGCVATAMEQILSYYRRTYVLQDTLHGWTSDHYDIPDVLPGEQVDSRLIRADYADSLATPAEVDAVARLSYWLGVACHMKWGVSESAASTSRFVEPLQRAFGLKYVHYLDSYQYDPTAYWNFLAAELMQGRPVYYAGSIMRTGGHAFVLDGLDSNGLFHVNWGYGGEFDGYFRLDVLAYMQPDDQRREEFVESGFFCNQEALVVCPDEVSGVLPPDTLARTGREIELLGMWTEQPPQTGCYTQVMLDVRNTADCALTTPFALVQSMPADTARLAQGDWLAFTGRTLAAGQRDTLSVHVQFARSGDSWLCITPDGLQVIDSLRVQVEPGGTLLIEAEQPEVAFPAPLTARFSIPLSNPEDTTRAAQFFEYDLLNETTQQSRRITHFIYLQPGESRTDTVQFSSLQPGGTYTLRVRRRWPIVQSLTITVPVPAALHEAGELTRDKGPESWYTLSGQRVCPPLPRGVYLRRQGGRVQPVIY